MLETPPLFDGRFAVKKMLGQVLVESGMITSVELNTALEKQKTTSQKLGEILIGMGVITPDQLKKALESD